MNERVKSAKNYSFHFDENEKTHSIFLAEEWLGSAHLVTKSLKRGIALHHGGIPQIVGDAILNDFRQKKYLFIVANNTLAQGVNLPIRTVIIHSCYRYNERKEKMERISTREYWNIAGRAGRATEETEGLIIHIQISNQDKRDINYYLEHKENVEPVNSALYKSLIQLIKGRLSENTLKEELDPEILALLVEEENLSDEIMFEILNGSISEIQATKNRIPFEKIREIALDVAKEINETISNPKIRALYSSTGLRTHSCKIIHTHVLENKQNLIKIFLKNEFFDIYNLIDLFLSICIQIPELKPKKKIEINQNNLLKSWISGYEINHIIRNSRFELSVEDLTSIIGDYFSYKLPWGISSYLNIAFEVLGIKKSFVQDYIKFFPSMVKFGVPNPVACWAMSIGITSRKIAINFADRYLSETDSPNYEDFLEWINQINIDVLSYDFNLKSPLIEDVSNSIFNSSFNDLLRDFQGIERVFPLFVEVKGINYGKRQKNLRFAQIGNKIELVRDYDNKIDKNSILVLLFNQDIGYIPREITQILALEIDIGTQFDSTIIDFDEFSGAPIIIIDIHNSESEE